MRRILAIAALLPFAPPSPALSGGGVGDAEAIAVANRDAKVSKSAASTRPSPRASKIDDGNWEVSYFAGGERVGAGVVDPTAARSASRGPATRSPGRWLADTPAPLATSSTRPMSSCPSVALFLPRPDRLAPALAGRQPRPGRPARLRSLELLLQQGRNRGVGPDRFYPCSSTCSPAGCGSGCAGGARASGRSGRRPGWSSPRCS